MSARILAIVDMLVGLVAKPNTVRTASEEFGVAPAARYARELDRYSDQELVRRDRAALLAEIRASRRSKVGTR